MAKSDYETFSLRLEKEHLKLIRKISHERSLKEDKEITLSEMFRQAIEEKYPKKKIEK